jgi:flagellar basal-body rod modification protein FlgD
MPVSPLTSALSGTAGAAQKQSLGQDEFLKMMLAQIKNQDPLKPLEPAQFLGQLAQFSTVTGIQGMQSSLTALNNTLGSSSLMEGASLVGRDVLSASNTTRLPVAGSVTAAVVAPSAASSIQVNVRDVSGALVRQFSVPADDGLVDLVWDGNANNGQRAAAGIYTMEAVARIGSAGQSLETMMQNRVNSVTVDPSSGSLTLNTSGGAVPLSAVRRVQ